MLFSTLEGPNNLPVEMAHLDERHANRTASVLEWYEDIEHNTTSGSNEEEDSVRILESSWKCLPHPKRQ